MAADFTGDGHLDLAVTDLGTNDVTILLGHGNGTFRQEPAISLGAGMPSSLSLVAGDFTGNGFIDLAVASEDLFNGASISVLLGNGNGTFQLPNEYLLSFDPEPVSIVTGDFTDDGHLDLAVTSEDFFNFNGGSISLLLGNGDGTFQPQVINAVGFAPSSLVAGDFNGDGYGDPLLVTLRDRSHVSMLLGNGDGTFTIPSQFATTPNATPLVAEFNGDDDDLLEVDAAGDILYRQGIPQEPGSFLAPVTINPGFPSRDIALVTTGGRPVLASVDSQDDAISLYAWRDGGFRRIGLLTTGQLPEQVVSADLDGDGSDDLVVRNAGEGTLSVFFGTSLSNIKFVGPVGSSTSTFLTPVTPPVSCRYDRGCECALLVE